MHMTISKPNPTLFRNFHLATPTVFALCALVATASAQQGRPAPMRPVSQAAPADAQASPQDADDDQSRGGDGRRPLDGPKVKLGFQEVSVGEMIELSEM